MKKALLTILICGAMIFCISGCSDKQNTSKDNKEVPKEVSNLKQKYSDVKKDDLKWDYNTSTKTIVISGKGMMKNYLEEEPEWNYLSQEAEKIIVGDEVTTIGDGAFLLFSNVKEVKLGDSIEYIGARSFDFCTSLRTINFPNKIKYIGDLAFNNTILHSENGFILPEGLIYLGNSAFHSAFKESYVSIPESLDTIEDNALANCYVEEFRVNKNNKNYKSVDGILYDKNITTLINYPALKNSKIFEIPSTIKTIKENAIEVTNDLEKIVVPKDVATIEEKSIFWNYGLKYIEVDKDNNNYMSIDGVLYSKDGKFLISYPIASERDEYTVLDTVEEIQSYSISSAKNLRKIYIKEGVTSLNYGSLYLCENLEELHLPKSLNKIDEYALEYNDKLKLIKYASDKSDWDLIKIEDNNTILKSNNIKIEYIINNN